METEKYFKCPKCRVTRNIEEAPDCVICKDNEIRGNQIKRGAYQYKPKKDKNTKI